MPDFSSPESSFFPSVWWADRAVSFVHDTSPVPAEKVAAVVVFACHKGQFVIADIPGRGWCTPSGRLEPGESPFDAALRETWEEIGAHLRDPRLIGHFVFDAGTEAVMYVPTYLGWVEAFGKIPENSESKGAVLFEHAQLPTAYWHWDDLLESVFLYAGHIAREAEDAGIPGVLTKEKDTTTL